MEALSEQDIINFIRENISPVIDSSFGPGYRTSVFLTDGTFLPCVVFRSTKSMVELAMRRLREEQSGRGIFAKSSGLGYEGIVKTFVTKGNCVNVYDIAKVIRSRFAFPLEVIKQIRGETTMGWTAFVAKFKDGRSLGFGTRWHTKFFDLPETFNPGDIDEIINNSYLLPSGEIVHHGSLGPTMTIKDLWVNREKPFFECYLEGL